MQMNDTGSGCNMLELAVPEPCGNLQLNVSDSGHTVEGYAKFAGPILTGKITFVSGKQPIHILHCIALHCKIKTMSACSRVMNAVMISSLLTGTYLT